MPPYDVFLAHATPDQAAAEALHAALIALGLRPFCGALDLLPGDDWDLVLPGALRQSRIAALLVGATYDAAYYLRDEVALSVALARQDPTGHRAVPVFLHGQPAQVPYGLNVKAPLDWPALGGAPGGAAALARAAGASVGLLGAALPVAAPGLLDRVARYDVLVRLLPSQFREILVRADAPLEHLPAGTASLADQALSASQWLETQPIEARRAFDARLRKMAPGLFEI